MFKHQFNRNDSNRVTAMIGSVYDFSTNKSVPLSQSFVMPEQKMLVTAEGMLLLPAGELHFFSNKESYIYAYKLDYSGSSEDPLVEKSVKTKLKGMYKGVIESCTEGAGGVKNGLASYFRNKDFKGFDVQSGIELDSEKQELFAVSVRQEFEKYYATTQPTPTASMCEEAVRGLNMIVSAAAMINGFWLPNSEEFFQN